MFVPDVYRESRDESLVTFIEDHPLALFTTAGGEGRSPRATHLPAILAEPNRVGGLVGATVLGHMNRVNPQFTSLKAGEPALLVFSGPNGYISPTVYDSDGPLAPTWNFVAVHLEGRVVPLEAGNPTMHVVRTTVKRFEARFGDHWQDEESLAYFRQIISGVGAFAFEITRADGQYKLSQDKSPEVQNRIAGKLHGSPRPEARGLSELMADRLA